MTSFVNHTLNYALKLLIIATFIRYTTIETITFVHIHFIGPEYTYCNIYVPSNFNKEEIKLLQEATNEWETKTNHIIVYRIFFHPEQIDKYDHQHSLAILKANPANEAIKRIDKELSKFEERTTLGFYDPNHIIPIIILVPDRIYDNETYKAVMMHELGHALGLGHNPQKNTLMYETINEGSPSITHNDIVAFCNLYYCDPNKLPH